MRYLLLLSVLLLGTCWAVAQGYQNQANQTSAGTQTTVQSCLSKLHRKLHADGQQWKELPADRRYS
jgi:hypothetical protein